MFIANAITVWVEAMKLLFGPDYDNPDLQNITIGTDYPQTLIEFPNIWVNFVVNGDVSNVGIGHVEYADQGDDTFKEYLRWSFSGHVEFVIGSMGNLERALLVDEVSKAIAIGRVGENEEGILRSYVTQSNLVGMVATWEEFAIAGMNETIGTPWGSDDVIYEATISLPVEGEVVLDPKTGDLIPLSEIRVTPLDPSEGPPPAIGSGTPVGVWV